MTMCRSDRLARDQTWGELTRQLTYKAAWAGREFATMNPAYTSQTCSNCGARTPQEHYLVHRCTACDAPPRAATSTRRAMCRRGRSGLSPHDT